MKNSNSLENGRAAAHRGFSIRSLTIAALIGICGAAGSATVYAQSTAGTIFGVAPAGDSISAKSTTNGLQRRVMVASDGRYHLAALPVGVYTVTLEKNGAPLVKHEDVAVNVNRGMRVDFNCDQGQCEETASK